MNTIILVSHGPLAESLIKSAEMIVGEMRSVTAITLDVGDSPEELEKKMDEMISSADSAEGILFLVDLPGATPFNLAAKFAYQNDDIALISGLNLPMLLEVALLDQDISLQDLEAKALEAGKTGIKTLTDLM